MINKPEKLLITAGGRIKCHRCQARSSRTKQQCGCPSLKNKAVCKWHGGMSTGPRTKEGIQRIREAHLKHGERTKESIEERQKTLLRLHMLEEIGHHIKMFAEGSPRTRGRKPTGWEPLNLAEPNQMALAILKTMPNK
jgi:hypothetical protein